MKYPRIYLAINNCFASKRWTIPETWMKIASDCGFSYVESSADTECDMLYSEKGYLADWVNNVKKGCEKYNTHISCVYTGHGTYSTLGLTHTDSRCRDYLLKEWMYPHIDNACIIGSCVGFYCHAFDDSILQDSLQYKEYLKILFTQLKNIAVYAASKNVITALEQMYSPQQYPWRISDAISVIREISRCGTPMYITIDTGHQYGQQRFIKPSEDEINNAIKNGTSIYVGPQICFDIFNKALSGEVAPEDAADKIIKLMDCYPHMFADINDSDTWAWISKLGKYSPVIHLQQTNNTASMHKDFTETNNKNGFITGDKLLKSLFECYNNQNENDMPPPVENIYLTLELFYSNVACGDEILRGIAESAKYWRKFIPSDGMKLDELVALLNK